MNRGIVMVLLLTVLLVPGARAASNIDDVNRYAYGANVGWINCVADTNNGAVVGQFFCSGYIYGANIGWIRLGDGSPDNGYEYSNTSATDYGVNHDGLGNLRGYAYGANIGWIKFEDNGAPTVSLLTGNLSGSIYGANIGWISLNNAMAFVQADNLAPGDDSDNDRIPDSYEYRYAGDLGTLYEGGDWDGDGANDEDEYPAGTDPKNFFDVFEIVDAGQAAVTNIDLTWSSKQTRFYRVEKASSVTNGTTWSDSGLGLQAPDAGVETTRLFTDPAGIQRTYRVRAIVPLAP